jgi:hypothetical protein
MDGKIKEPVQTRIIAFACTLLAALCLLAGFLLGRNWVNLLLLLVIPLAWVFLRKASAGLTSSILLFAYIFLAVVGLLNHLSPYLLIGGCAFALGAWESTQFLLNFRNSPVRSANQRLENFHNKDLGLAVGFGLLLALVGLNIRLRLPFGLIAVLALLAAYGLYRGFKYH